MQNDQQKSLYISLEQWHAARPKEEGVNVSVFIYLNNPCSRSSKRHHSISFPISFWINKTTWYTSFCCRRRCCWFFLRFVLAFGGPTRFSIRCRLKKRQKRVSVRKLHFYGWPNFPVVSSSWNVQDVFIAPIHRSLLFALLLFPNCDTNADDTMHGAQVDVVFKRSGTNSVTCKREQRNWFFS